MRALLTIESYDSRVVVMINDIMKMTVLSKVQISIKMCYYFGAL